MGSFSWRCFAYSCVAYRSSQSSPRSSGTVQWKINKVFIFEWYHSPQWALTPPVQFTALSSLVDSFSHSCAIYLFKHNWFSSLECLESCHSLRVKFQQQHSYVLCEQCWEKKGFFFATLPDLLETKLLQQHWERDHIMLVEQIDRGYYYRTSAASLDDRSRRRQERRRILISIIKMGSALEWVSPYFLLLQHCTNNEPENVWRKVYWKLHHILETVMRVTWLSSCSTLFPWILCYIFHLKV